MSGVNNWAGVTHYDYARIKQPGHSSQYRSDSKNDHLISNLEIQHSVHGNTYWLPWLWHSHLCIVYEIRDLDNCVCSLVTCVVVGTSLASVKRNCWPLLEPLRSSERGVESTHKLVWHTYMKWNSPTSCYTVYIMLHPFDCQYFIQPFWYVYIKK